MGECEGRGRTDLWCEIVGCTAERPCRRRTVLREAEICHFDVPVRVEQNIFGLEVAVYDVLGMQVIECQRYLGGVEFCYWFRKPLSPQTISVSSTTGMSRLLTFDRRKRVNSSPPGTKSMTM